MKKLPIGISDFKKLIEENHYFIDKSLFIKDIIDEDAEVILLPRPRRFGKTLNLSMLYYFFNNTEEDYSYLFKGLKIEDTVDKYLDKQGKYPVIELDFKGAKADDWSSCFDNIKRVIAKEYKRHSYLLDSDSLMAYEKEEYKKIISYQANSAAYQFSLENLSEYLKKYHNQKVIVLIDEYDEPIQSGYMNGFYSEVIDFMKGLLTRGLKGNVNLEKGILTGILRIAKESIFSGLNNLVVSTLLETKYDSYFGLLEEEVEEIFNNYNLEYRLAKIKEWYNGYYFGEKTLYNPWSIINCIYYQGELKPYWVNTSGNEIIKELIINGDSEIKSDLELLIKNQSIEKKIDENIVFADIDKKSSSLWSFLLLSGYLRASSSKRRGARLYCDLEIPNQEVQYIYEEIILDWFEENITSRKLELMLEALTSGDIDVFSSVFREFVLNTMSSFDVGGDSPEKVYHAFVLGLLLNLRDDYQVKSNRESGYGRYDVMIIPNQKDKLGIIIEFKKTNTYKKESLKEAVEEAIKQIREKRYKQELLAQGIDNILELGIAFSGKDIIIEKA